MSRLIRLSLILALVAAFLPIHSASAQSAFQLPAGCELQSSGNLTELYLICMPEKDKWNHGVLVFAHGYVPPNGGNQLFLNQLVLPDGSTLIDIPLSMGYAFIATSYRQEGLAIVQGVEDVIGLVDHFKRLEPDTEMVLLTGASEGGLITTLALEQRPDLFAGGLATCGPIGDFQGQVNFFGDFRVVFDYFFPGIMPGSPINMPASLWPDWDAVSGSIQQAMASSPSKSTQLIRVTKASIDPLNPGPSSLKTAEEVLWYNMFATNNAREILQGQPFNNRFRWYFGSSNDLLLNYKVERFSPTGLASSLIAKDYQTSGKLSRPLVTMHNLYDPVVPYWHEPLYRIKTFMAQSMSKYTNIPIPTYGHCNFTKLQVVAAFGILLYQVTGVIPAGVDIQSVPIEPNEPPQQIYLPLVGG